ncbi:MAG: pectate lyase [Prevotella sp.]|nr:pectate lyase [Prevotella sp.]
MAQAPAFPGAEGHGRYTTGGREGVVRHVTTLVDDGKTSTVGSLRWAVNGSAKKIVVFDVAGVINLTRELTIGANTTIAGQTAPEPGITLRYHTVRPNGNNIIMRYIRIRRGEEKDVDDGADATWARQFKGMVLDHCSFSWSIDEIASFYDNRDFTMQWCSLGEALANPGHSKGEHSYGGIWGGKGASFHHNFIAHVQNRAPRFCGARYGWTGYDNTKYANPIQAEIVDFRNCVMYNWGNGNGCYGGTGGGNINIVNNYYKAGPATANKTRVTQISVATSSNASGSAYMGYTARYYINGNYVTAAGSNAANYDWKGVKYDSGTYQIDGEYCSPDAAHLYGDNVTYYKNSSNVDCVRIKLTEPVETGEVTTHSAEKAYEKVLDYVGASLYRDAVDTRYANEARNGTTTYTGSAPNVTHYPGIIDFVSDQGTYTLTEASRPANFDTDGDGIPDAWETANGLNPNDANDGKLYTIDTKGWYTNVEVYINSLVQDIVIAGNADAESGISEYFPVYKNEQGQTVTAIEAIDATTDIVRTEYYTLQGTRLSQPQRGIVVEVRTLSNGTKLTRKLAVK